MKLSRQLCPVAWTELDRFHRPCHCLGQSSDLAAHKMLPQVKPIHLRDSFEQVSFLLDYIFFVYWPVSRVATTGQLAAHLVVSVWWPVRNNRPRGQQHQQQLVLTAGLMSPPPHPLQGLLSTGWGGGVGGKGDAMQHMRRGEGGGAVLKIGRSPSYSGQEEGR